MNKFLGAAVVATMSWPPGRSSPARAPKPCSPTTSRKSTRAGAWDTPDVQVEDGKVKVKAQPDISNLLIYKGILFSDADICLSVRMPNVVSNSDNTMAARSSGRRTTTITTCS